MVRDEDFIAGVMTRRCLAWLIDLVLIGLILIPIVLILTLFGLLTLGLGFAAMAVLPAVPFLYHFLSLMRSASATPGQGIMGLTVRRDADLGPPTGGADRQLRPDDALLAYRESNPQKHPE